LIFVSLVLVLQDPPSWGIFPRLPQSTPPAAEPSFSLLCVPLSRIVVPFPHKKKPFLPFPECGFSSRVSFLFLLFRPPTSFWFPTTVFALSRFNVFTPSDQRTVSFPHTVPLPSSPFFCTVLLFNSQRFRVMPNLITKIQPNLVDLYFTPSFRCLYPLGWYYPNSGPANIIRDSPSFTMAVLLFCL